MEIEVDAFGSLRFLSEQLGQDASNLNNAMRNYEQGSRKILGELDSILKHFEDKTSRIEACRAQMQRYMKEIEEEVSKRDAESARLDKEIEVQRERLWDLEQDSETLQRLIAEQKQK